MEAYAAMRKYKHTACVMSAKGLEDLDVCV